MDTNKSQRERTSLETWAFFDKSTKLSAIIDPKRWFHWKSLNPTNQPLISAPWDQLITLPTVVNFFLLLVLSTTVNSRPIIIVDQITYFYLVNIHIRLDKLGRKQSALQLWESDSDTLLPKIGFILILLWCRFVAHLHGVFTDIEHYSSRVQYKMHEQKLK